MLPQLGSRAYHHFLHIAAFLGHSKAKKWHQGRKESKQRLAEIDSERSAKQRLIWMHAASLGEFEQGIPVFEALKASYPEAYFVLSFFSPSGYEARKNYPLANKVVYLPVDRAQAAIEWVNTLRPSLAIFIKYEFWPYHLKALHEASVPTALIAASFRKSQPFFRWFGKDWRKLLQYFDRIIVQTTKDQQLLEQIHQKSIVGGDPRVDRVLSLAEGPFEDHLLAQFSKGHRMLLAGSVWPADVAILAELIDQLPKDWRMVLAPHQLHDTEIAKWATQLGAIRYTDQKTENNISSSSKKVMILDTIGILSKAYRYADLAYIGGGFGAGIHNTLEPMAYSLPVIFGPKYHKFPEAVLTVANKGSFVVQDAEALKIIFSQLQNKDQYLQAQNNILAYTTQSKGATQRTMNGLPKID